MDQVISPLILYAACGLGALGVVLAMPRRRGGIAAIGGLIAAIAAGGVLLGMIAIAGPAGQAPNLYFYVFGALALASGLRMITHPRPVYAALYFILTIIASSGLYVLLSAEFMAFALIIIYAGAILITYLFVIMLATQAPSEEEDERISEYDAVAREPVAAAVAGFALLAVISTMLFSGVTTLDPAPSPETPDRTLAGQPLKIERLLLEPLRATKDVNGTPYVDETEVLATIDSGDGPQAIIDTEDRTVVVRTQAFEDQQGGALRKPLERIVKVPDELWPPDLQGTNVEALGLNLLRQHPMTIEIAGVILLMAMLGATVLARKQVDIEEALKAGQARRLASEVEDAEVQS